MGRSYTSDSWANRPATAEEDSLKPRYSVRKTAPETLEDLDKSPADLKEPDNLKTEVYFDEATGKYAIGTKAGKDYVSTPIYLTPEEYATWSMKQSLAAFYRAKNSEIFTQAGKEKFDFTDMKFDIGPAEKIFGPGGVQIKTQGNAELSFGGKMRKDDNPTIAVNRRKTFGFDFDEKINVNVNGKVGDKVNMNLNYNTDATFDFDTKKMKLKYEGKEDEIIKLLEAGNVSMPTNSSLIRGATSLFGMRADLQFGKLKLQAVVSQQESESKTVTSRGGAQTTDFEIEVSDYDENRHFFLAHYFRNNYDKNMTQLPNIISGIEIQNIEVWVTNKRGNYDNPRNIVGFADLGEYDRILCPYWQPQSVRYPSNKANNLYATMAADSSASVRNINTVTQTLEALSQQLEAQGLTFTGGRDYDKIESARLLTSSEYTVNKKLGYISLRQALQPDEVLAVAFDYTIGNQRYQVGEFSSDIKNTESSLYVKLLKNTSNSPDKGCWDLMMKNVYSLGAYQIQKDKFRLDILYQSDTTGVYLNYIPEGRINKRILLRVMNLDRLDAQDQPHPNGFFDFVEGYTVSSQRGQVFFPVIEPFGSHLRDSIGNNAIADKYVFQELYDSTKTVAKQIAEKNKFKMKGEYKASSGSEIRLDAMNIPVGSVKVTAGGRELVENQDYTVDYTMGIVTIQNQSIIDAGTAISVNLESNTSYNMQRKTMLGMNFTYDFTKDFQIGGTIMHLKEKPLTTKVSMGDEPISNTLWGLNTAWKKESQWLTNMLDKIPFVNVTQPSSVNLTAEFAQLIPGHAKGIQDDASYIDDFEATQTGISINQPYNWMMSSTPSFFKESTLSDSLEYGKNRALMSWYNVNPLFTRKNSSLTPSHIKNDLGQQSNHYVREVYEREIFPNKEATYGESATLSVMNIAYYPDERGPYNLDTDLTPEGKLNEPAKRWGGMMRKLDTSDFEASNIEYIEFWMLDPFIYDSENPAKRGGSLYINLGDVSEDILKDGKKFYENGMPIDGDPAKYTTTVWGRVPKDRSIVYAFDNSSGARKKQDVGLNGLSSEEEREFPAYQRYLEEIRGIITDQNILEKFIQDPAGDNFHYFRGSDYDAAQVSILDRYKYYNNTEGNSADTQDSSEKYSTSVKTSPDVEDINEDNTMSEFEKYFQYKIEIDPGKLMVGNNYITDKRTTTVKLRNGSSEEVNWYQFKIPVKDYEKAVGAIKNFKSIRFMRMFLTDFEQPVILRFATLELVRGEWRTYEQSLYTDQQSVPSSNGTIEATAVNIEENSEKEPVNYVLPPGISRVIDPGQPQLRQDNEQALSLKIRDLATGDARAVYKNSGMDMRQYKRLQMYVHGEKLIDDNTNLEDGQMAVFIRLGSDYKNNYYEYEIPLKLTPHGHYDGSTASGCQAVWPQENMLDIDFSVLTDLKKERNTQKNTPGTDVSFNKLFYSYDPAKPANKVSIMGNPSLSEVKTIMIGVRNNSRSIKSVEVWVNELRLTDFNEEGGWAAQGNLNIQLSDLGTVNVGGHVETAGFGGLEQSVSERRMDDYYQYTFTTSFELGKFFPEKAKLSAPIYFSYSKEKLSPKYNPLDQDILLKDALDTYTNKHEKDSIRSIAEELTIYKNFSLSNVRVGITSKNPMPYDPANFTFGYSFTRKFNQGNTTSWEKENDWRANFGYSYSPAVKPLEPFKNLKNKSKWLKIVKEFNINWLPQSVAFNTDMARNYYELQLRDLNNPYGDSELPLSFAKQFLWNREFAIRWDLTKALRLNFTSATHAEIEEPYGPVNKDLYPDEYSAWKDSVKRSIVRLGRPMDYQQTFNASYQLPLNKIPIFDWITGDAKFSSSYNWNRGSVLTDGTSLGNTVANQRSFDISGRFNFETLYNKVPFLKGTNRKFSAQGSRSNMAARNQGRNPGGRNAARGNATDKESKKPKNFIKEVQLKPDTTLVLTHNMDSKRPKVTALTADGKRYILQYKVLDKNKIRIENQDSIQVKVTVLPGRKAEDQKWYKTLQYAARFAMMVRNASFSYRNTYAMTLPGFVPEVGDMLGQIRNNGIFSPGLDFAFGMQGESYIGKAVRNNWLLKDSLVSAATTNALEDLQIRVTLEPVRDLKIDLNASRTMNKAKDISFMYEGLPETRSGNFSMTVISIGSAFGKSKAGNGYSSKTFDKFLHNLDAIQQRVEAQYTNAFYPKGSALEGQTFNPANGTVSKYAPDVMIPAFLSAYTGKDAGKVSLDFFPKLFSMMPNWKITYNGLSKLDWFKKYFKSFTLNHMYSSIYSVGSYNTFQSFLSYMGDLGFIEDVQTNNPVPSTMYNISMVSINERFAPLLGVDMTFHNNMTAKVEYKTTRILNLSMAANQIVETSSKDFVIGLGYKIADLKLFGGGVNQKNPVSNDLNIRADFSFRNQSALCRDIQQISTQATSGNKAIKFSCSADYTFSRLLTLRLYFDRQKNLPLVSSASYPVITNDFGVSIKFSLTR